MIKNIRFLNSNALKIIAAISMLIDHIGFLLFPSVAWLRFIGRIAMPIFAFFISEGCRYTKNKLKYFLMVFILGALCQIVYFLSDPKDNLYGILITFSLSILLIYSFNYMKKNIVDNEGLIKIILSTLLFILVFFGIYQLTQTINIDYGFMGIVLPLFCSILDFKGVKNQTIKKLDKLVFRVLLFSVGIIIFYLLSTNKFYSIYSLFAIPLLLLYNGNRGKLNMKYFFYLFYPLHLVVLEGIFLLINS